MDNTNPLLAGLVIVALVAFAIHARRNEESLAKYVLSCWSLMCFAYAAMILISARSAIHEIQGGVALLIGTIAAGLAAVIAGLDQLRKSQTQVTVKKTD